MSTERSIDPSALPSYGNETWGAPVVHRPMSASADGLEMPVPSGVPSPALVPADVERAVASANVPTLLATLVQLTGSRGWLDDRYRPERPRGIAEDPGGGLSQEVQDEIRGAAATAISDWLDGKAAAISRFEPDSALEVLSFSVGEEVPGEYAEYLAAELDALNPAATEEATSSAAGDASDRSLAGLTVAIIGAGVSGIAAANALMPLGADVVLFERAKELGGTWHLNRYPGCGVDTASHLYSFSYAPGDWSYYYAPQSHLEEYLKQVADRHGVTSRVRLGTEVTAAAYDAQRVQWRVSLRTSDGQPGEFWADVLISAVGMFGNKSMPRIPGLDEFGGVTYHTAEWPADADLVGKRVAVVGTGASAMQLVPAVVDAVSSLTVFQRTPQWAAPFAEFHKPIDEATRSLIRSVPAYRAWYRARLGWMLNDKVHESLQIDPEWDDEGRSINVINAAHRRFFSRYMERELGGDQELLAKALPSYPPFGKRMLLDNGWFRALRRDHVDLVVDPIERVEKNGVRTRTGELVEVDVLVLATGFDVVHYLSSVDVLGLDGQILREVWNGDDGRAYLGMTVTGFPNLFCLYGPNAAPGHGGSYMGVVEAQLNYIVDLIAKMREAGAKAVDVERAVYDDYSRRVDDAHAKMIWTAPGVSTYYQNAQGRIIYANPFRIVDFWHMTRSADLADYALHMPA